MTDIGEWYQQMPRFTKHWLTCTVGLSLLARFGIVPVHLLPLIPSYIWEHWHIWRPATALFFYPLNPNTGFHFMLNCFFLYNYSMRLETEQFKQSPGDYLFLLTFNWLCCVIVGLFASFPLLMDPMILSVLYVWCQLNKDTIVNFWFGTRFKAMYLPWVLLAFNTILSGGGMFSVVGILVGHLYFFLKFKMPQELGYASYLETPAFIKQYFPDIRGGVHGFGVPPVNLRTANENQQNAQPNRFFNAGGGGWGTGQRLGTD